MGYDEFSSSLKEDEPAPDLPPLLQALWWDAKGNWGQAHEIAQEIDSRDAAWVHAYLHRKEGDTANAQYWYSLGGRKLCQSEVEVEWREIVESLLGEESIPG